MSIYTVHQPPLRKTETAPDTNRFVFVRDGFYFWGFVLAPLWLMRHRLWLVLVLYVSLTALLDIALRLSGAPLSLRSLVAVMLAFLVGLEGASLRRWTLARRGFRNVGVVAADDLESAERRFFASFIEAARKTEAPAPAPKIQANAPLMPADGTPDIVGLFPRPDSAR